MNSKPTIFNYCRRFSLHCKQVPDNKIVKLKFDFSLFNNDFSTENLNNIYTTKYYLYVELINSNINFLKSLLIEKNLIGRSNFIQCTFQNININFVFFTYKHISQYSFPNCTKEVLLDKIVDYLVTDMRDSWFQRKYSYLKHLSYEFMGSYFGLKKKRISATFDEKKNFYILFLKDLIFRNYFHKDWKNKNFLFLLNFIFKKKNYSNMILLKFFFYNLIPDCIFLKNNYEFLKFYKIFIFFLVKEKKLNKIYLKNLDLIKKINNLELFYLKNLIFEFILNDFLVFFEKKQIFSLVTYHSWNKKKELNEKILKKSFNFKNFLIDFLDIDLKHPFNFFNYHAPTLYTLLDKETTWNWLITQNIGKNINSETSYTHLINFYDLFYYLNTKLFLQSQNIVHNNSFMLDELEKKSIEYIINKKLPYYAKGPWLRTSNNITRIYIICYYINLVPDNWFIKNKDYLNKLYKSLTGMNFDNQKPTVKYLRNFYANYLYTMHRKPDSINSTNNFLKLLHDSLTWVYQEEYIYFKIFDKLKGPIPSYFYGTNYLLLKFFYLLLNNNFIYENDILFMILNKHRNKLYKHNEFYLSDTAFLDRKELYYLYNLIMPSRNVFLSCLYEDILFEITNNYAPNAVPNQERFKFDTILLPNLQWDVVKPY